MHGNAFLQAALNLIEHRKIGHPFYGFKQAQYSYSQPTLEKYWKRQA